MSSQDQIKRDRVTRAKALGIALLVAFCVHQVMSMRKVGVKDLARLKPSNQGVTLKH